MTAWLMGANPASGVRQADKHDCLQSQASAIWRPVNGICEGFDVGPALNFRWNIQCERASPEYETVSEPSDVGLKADRLLKLSGCGSEHVPH